jgi:hypothetical protein
VEFASFKKMKETRNGDMSISIGLRPDRWSKGVWNVGDLYGGFCFSVDEYLGVIEIRTKLNKNETSD